MILRFPKAPATLGVLASLFIGCASRVTASAAPAPAPPPDAYVRSTDKGCGWNAAECERMCASHDYDACSMLGSIYQDGAPAAGGIPSAGGASVAPNPSRAFELYERACQGGSNSGCVNFGNAYERGEIAPPSTERARQAFLQTCERGYSWGCMRLGLLELAAHRRPEGIVALRRSCKRLEAEPCWVFASALLDVTSGTEREEALAVLAATCRKGAHSASDEYSRARAERFSTLACERIIELRGEHR